MSLCLNDVRCHIHDIMTFFQKSGKRDLAFLLCPKCMQNRKWGNLYFVKYQFTAKRIKRLGKVIIPEWLCCVMVDSIVNLLFGLVPLVLANLLFLTDF